jgi:hypothetical protein
MVDVWAYPAHHNRKVQRLRYRTGYYPPRWSGFLAPTGPSSAVGGLTLRF